MRIKDGIDDEWMEVTGVASATTYTVTRDLAGDYAPNSNPEWKKGATIVNYRQSGDGGVYMTASDTNAPYLSIFDHTGSPWSSDNINTRLRIGNLNGYLGYTDDLYGIAIGEASDYLKYDPTNGLRIAGAITASTINIGTNGFHVDVDGNIWWGSSNTYAGATIKISSAGVVNFTSGSFTGTITSTSGTIGGWAISSPTISGGGIILDSSAGTITGGIIRTSSGSNRVEMKNDNTLTFYSGGISRTFITSGILGFNNPAGAGSGSMYGYGTENVVIDPGDTPYHFSASAFYPQVSGDADIGTSGSKWGDGYFAGDIVANNISGTNTGDQDLSGYATLSGATFTGSLETFGSGAHISVGGNAFLRLKSMTGATAAGLAGIQSGAMYFRNDDNKLRVYIFNDWYTINVTLEA
ncbi:MAG TPA: hypothetical protein ENH99_01435 [Candidatus Pacearchaeota archaeon]|nr:hypothetical protein [Candidatus Pacearchaeota archaeon]